MRQLIVAGVFAVSTMVSAAPDAYEVLGMSEFACQEQTHGISSATADKNFPANTPLCLQAISCEVVTPFNFEDKTGKVAWDKGTKFGLSFACAATDNGKSCPSARECAKISRTQGKPYGWIKASGAASSTLASGDGMSCKYTYSVEPRVLVRATDEKWTKVDGICSSTVTCNPALKDSVAVCKPRKANLAKYEFECPSAMDCVAERFPLEQPKVDIAARPHGGAPTQSGSNGSTHTRSNDR